MEDILPKQKTRKNLRHFERVTLDTQSVEKIDSWIKQVTEKTKGIHVNRKDAVNWWIQNGASEFSKSDEKKFVDEFYDPEHVLQEALKEVRLAKARGEEPTLQDVIVMPQIKDVTKKSSRNKKAEAATSISINEKATPDFK